MQQIKQINFRFLGFFFTTSLSNIKYDDNAALRQESTQTIKLWTERE
jgi:hypothetical protein